MNQRKKKICSDKNHTDKTSVKFETQTDKCQNSEYDCFSCGYFRLSNKCQDRKDDNKRKGELDVNE